MLVALAAAFIAEACQNPAVVAEVATNSTMLGHLIMAGMGPYHSSKVAVLLALCTIADAGTAAVECMLPLGVIDLVVACCVDTALPIEALRYAAHLVAALAKSPTQRLLVGKRTLGVLMRNLTLDDCETVSQCLQALHVILEDSLAIDTFLQQNGLATVNGIFCAAHLRGAWANALRVLAQICRSTGGALAVVASECAPHVVQLYTDEEAELRSLAAIVVANAASFPELLDSLLALAAVEQLGACVLMHGVTDDIGIRACLMASLQFTGVFKHHAPFLQQRGLAFLPTLLAAMEPDVRVLSLGVVLNLARNASTHVSLCKAGIPAIVVNCLDDKSLQVQHAAVLACRALIQTPVACGAMTAAGCFPALARAMRCDHPDAVMNDIIAVVGNLTADVRSHTRFLSHELATALLNITASPTVQDRSLQLAASTLSNLQLSDIGRSLVLRCVTEMSSASDDALDFATAATVNLQRLVGDSLHCIMRVLVNLSATAGGAKFLAKEPLVRVMAQYTDSSSFTAGQLSMSFLFNLTLYEAIDAMPVTWFADYLVVVSKLIRHRSTPTKLRIHALQLLAIMLKAADVLEPDTVRYVIDSLTSVLSHDDATLRTLSALCVLTAFKSSSAIDLFGSSSAASVAIATLCDIRDTSVMAVLASTFCVWSFSPTLQKTLFATNPTSFCSFLTRSAVSLDARVQRLAAATMANLFEACAVPFMLMGHLTCILIALIDKGADAAVVAEALRGLTAVTTRPYGLSHILMQSAGRLTSVLLGPSASAALQARRCCANLAAFLASECFVQDAPEKRTVLDYFRLAMQQSMPDDECLMQYLANTGFIHSAPLSEETPVDEPLQISAALNSVWVYMPQTWESSPALCAALEQALASDNYFLKVQALQCVRYLCDKSRELACSNIPGVSQLVAGMAAIQDGVRDGLLEVLANVSEKATTAGDYFSERTLRLAWHEVLTAPIPRRRYVALLMLANIASTEERLQRRILTSLSILSSSSVLLGQLEQASQIALLRLIAAVAHPSAPVTADDAVQALVPVILGFCKSTALPLASAARLAEACMFDAFAEAIQAAEPHVLMQCFAAVEAELDRSLISAPNVMRATSSFLAMGAAHPLFDRELNHGDIGRTLCRLITLALTDQDSAILLLQTLRRGVMITGVVTLIDNDDFLVPVCKAVAADSSSRELNREVAALVAQCARARLMKTTGVLTPTFMHRLIDMWTPRATDPVCDSLWCCWAADTLQRAASHAGLRKAGLCDELHAAIVRMPVAKDMPFDDEARLAWQMWRALANLASVLRSADELFSLGSLAASLERIQRLPDFVLHPAYAATSNLLRAPRSFLAVDPRHLEPLRNLDHIRSREFGTVATAALSSALHSVRDVDDAVVAATLPAIQTALRRCKDEDDTWAMLPLRNLACDPTTHQLITSYQRAFFVRYMVEILQTRMGQQLEFIQVAQALCCTLVGRSSFFGSNLPESLVHLATGAPSNESRYAAKMAWLNACADEAAQLLRYHPLQLDVSSNDLLRWFRSEELSTRLFALLVLGNYRMGQGVYSTGKFAAVVAAALDVVAGAEKEDTRIAYTSALVNAVVNQRCTLPRAQSAVATMLVRFDVFAPTLRQHSLEGLVAILSSAPLRAAALPFAPQILVRFADPHLPIALRVSFYAAVGLSEAWRYVMATQFPALGRLLGKAPYQIIPHALPPLVLDQALQGHSELVGCISTMVQSVLAVTNLLAHAAHQPEGRLRLNDRTVRALILGSCFLAVKQSAPSTTSFSTTAVISRLLHGRSKWAATASVRCDEKLEIPVAARLTTAYGRLAKLEDYHRGDWENLLWWTDDPMFNVAKAASSVDKPPPMPAKLALLDSSDLVSMQPIRWSDGPCAYRTFNLRAYGSNPIAGRRQFALMRAKQQRRLAMACATLEFRGGTINPVSTLIAMHASRSHAAETSFISVHALLNMIIGSMKVHLPALRAVGFLPLRLIEATISKPLRVKEAVPSPAANGRDDAWNAAACAVGRGTLTLIDPRMPHYRHFPTASMHDPSAAAAQAIELASNALQGVWGPQAVLALQTIMSGGLDHDVIDDWARKIVHTTQGMSTLMYAQVIKQLSESSRLPHLSGKELVESIGKGRHMPWFPSPTHNLHRILNRGTMCHAVASVPQNAFQSLCLLLRLRRFDEDMVFRNPAARRVVLGALASVPNIIPAHVFHYVSTQLSKPLQKHPSTQCNEAALSSFVSFLAQLPTVVSTQLAHTNELVKLRNQLDVADLWLVNQLNALFVVGDGVRTSLGEMAHTMLTSPFAGDRIAAAESFLAEMRATGSKWRFGSMATSVLLARLFRDVHRSVNEIGLACSIVAATAAPPKGDIALQLRHAALAYTWTTGETASAGMHAAGLLPLSMRRELDIRLHKQSLEATSVLESNPYAVRSSFVRHLILLDRSFKTELDALTRPFDTSVLDRLVHSHPMFTVSNAADATVSIAHLGSLAIALNLLGEDAVAQAQYPLAMSVASQAQRFAAANHDDALLFDSAMHVLHERHRQAGFPTAFLPDFLPEFVAKEASARRLVAHLWAESWRMRHVPYPRTIAINNLQFDAEITTDLLLGHLQNLERADYTFLSPASLEIRELIAQALSLGSGMVEDMVSIAVILLCKKWGHTFERYLVGRTQLAVFQAWVSAVVRKLRKAHFLSVPGAAAAIASLQRLLGVKWHGVASELYE